MRWSTVLPGITVVGAVEEATTEGPTMTSANIDRMPLPALMIGCLFAATLAIGANTVAHPAIAGAERVWDVEDYDNCMDDQSGSQLDLSINAQRAFHAYCCNRSGGVFIDDGYLGKCLAPPAEPASGPRQLPGNVQIPTDIATAPTVNQAPTRVPPGIATAPTATAP